MTKIISSLSSWRPNIKELADTIILGPQRDLLSRLEMFNNRFHTDIGITRTYRWSPGIYKKIREKLFKLYELDMVKRSKLSTISNAHHNSKWRSDNFFRTLNEMETEMVSKRCARQVFQDNTELCERSLNYFIDNAKSNLESISNTIPGITCEGFIAMTHNKYQFFLVIKKSPYDLSLFLSPGENSISYSLPMEETIIYVQMDLSNYIIEHSRIKERDTLTNDELNELVSRNVHCKSYGKYNTEYKTRHPFVNRDSYGSLIIEGLNPNTGYKLNSVCYGSFSHIERLLPKFKWIELVVTINNWLTVFTNGSTNPLNNVRTLWHGILPNMDDTFRNVFNTTSDDCSYSRYLINHEEPSLLVDNLYCDKYNCILQSECKAYSAVTGNKPEIDPRNDIVPDTQNRIQLVHDIIDPLGSIISIDQLSQMRDRLDNLSLESLRLIINGMWNNIPETPMLNNIENIMQMIDDFAIEQHLEETDPEAIQAPRIEENVLQWVAANGGNAIDVIRQERSE